MIKKKGGFMTQSGLVHILLLDGNGKAKQITQKALNQWSEQQGTLWVHLNIAHPDALNWLNKKAGLEKWAQEALTNTEESRPRSVIHGDNLLLVLRTLNLTPRSEPDDLVFLRLFATSHRLITVSMHPALDFKEITKSFENNEGPTDINTLLDTILDTSLNLISDTISDLEDNLDDLEEQIIAGKINEHMSADLSEILRKCVVIRRYLSPEREALNALTRQKTNWFNEIMGQSAFDAWHRMERIIEDLDLLHDRTHINQEALTNEANKRSQRNMYMLSVMATLFLPLSFITGLFGMNVGGIPLSSSEMGLMIVTIIILLIGLFMLYIFKKLKWI